MSFSAEQVRSVAKLARLELQAEEESQFATQLGHILDYFERLSQLDTAQVAPTANMVGERDGMRDDQVTNPAGDSVLWSNAPALEDQQFRVPKIIE